MEVVLRKVVETAVEVSPNVLRVAGMFGLGVDRRRVMEVLPEVRLELRAGWIVFVTGPSGGGKSTLLRCLKGAVAGREDAEVLDLAEMPGVAERALVDCFEGESLEGVMGLLSVAGLNDAFVMLRKPSELSDGQRYRLRLARAMWRCERGEAQKLQVVVADEFGATLDRVTAGVIAANLRKWVSRNGSSCWVVATTHDDLLEGLEPDVVVEKGLGVRVEVASRHADLRSAVKRGEGCDAVGEGAAAGDGEHRRLHGIGGVSLPGETAGDGGAGAEAVVGAGDGGGEIPGAQG
ncbi:MAG: ATP-binding cassette domain-containing protein [Phycisphaeraceae bacterium]|nr:ATP-binding cassette domain-containing protein [Phycisphaeraceae bacterium]